MRERISGDEAGQTTVEYVLVVLLIAIVIFSALKTSEIVAIVGGAGEVIATMMLEAMAKVP